MKNRKCPNHKACWDYGDCEGCPVGDEITRLHKRIDRLKKQNETLTIQRNAWALAARAVKNDTVRKMQKLIKERCIKGGIYPAFVKSTIDQIAKEMIGEENGD